MKITFPNSQTKPVADLLPEPEQAFLFSDVTILQDIQCHLATARLSVAPESWAVITNTPLSFIFTDLCSLRSTFWGHRTTFQGLQIRNTDALARLLMLLATATIIAISTAFHLVYQGALNSVDWHAQRGLSFLQIGLRKIKQLCYRRQPFPDLTPLPTSNPPPACASL